MKTNREFYYVSDDAAAPVLMTCSRPLPGELIGYRSGTGFYVYNVAEEFLVQALALDAHWLRPTASWADTVNDEMLKTCEGRYSLADYYDAFDDPAKALQAAAESVSDKIVLCEIDYI